MSTIAKKYNMSTSELMALNPQVNEKGDIRPGQKIITKEPSKSLFDNINLPSDKKFIAKEVLQQATGINAADFLGLVPANAKAFLADLTGLGKEEGSTEKDLNNREKKALREAIKRAEAQGKDYLEYKDFASSANPYDDTGGGTFLQGFAPITKYFDPKYSMKTTLGQAKFKKNKDGTYTVTDEFNFNDATKAGFKGFIADAKVAPGLSKLSPYRILRSVARNFGSAEGEGMPVNITFQKGGIKPSTIEMSSDTIQGISSDQNAAKLKFERNIKKKGLKPFAAIVKSNTKVLKDKDGNYTGDFRDVSTGKINRIDGTNKGGMIINPKPRKGNTDYRKGGMIISNVDNRKK